MASKSQFDDNCHSADKQTKNRNISYERLDLGSTLVSTQVSHPFVSRIIFAFVSQLLAQIRKYIKTFVTNIHLFIVIAIEFVFAVNNS